MRILIMVVGALWLAALSASTAPAQTGTLAHPFAPPSPNAALHYQRALLLCGALDESDRILLQRSIWEVLPDVSEKGFPTRVKRLLYRARHATASAGKASRLETCDFGIDFADRGAATPLPHVKPMVDLARLLTLRGAYEEARGNWDEAAVIYFDGLRMGRHMAHQRTLLEAIAGIQIQENNFYALARWAARCPEKGLVARAFGLFETMSDELTSPSRTLASETAILALDFEMLKRTYPEGPWGEVVLESLDKVPTDDEQENRKQAVAACVDLGVPAVAFRDAKSFRAYLDQLEKLTLRFAEAAATSMQLPPKARIDRGQRLYQRYVKAAGAIGERGLLNPAEIGGLFAEHEAKTTVLRCCLAVAAQRDDQRFPEELEAIAGGFGSTVPTSPYDGSPLEYELQDNGKSFRLAVAKVRVGDVTLPRVEFNSAPPAAAKQ